MPEAPRQPRARRPGLWLLGVLGVFIVALIVLQALSGFFTNFLWFHSSGVGVVWGTIIGSKIVLSVVFIALAFVLFWMCLFLVDKVAPRAMFMAPDTELVRRYQSAIGPHVIAVRTVVSVILAVL